MHNRLAIGLAIGITVFLLLGTFGVFFWQQGYIRFGSPDKKLVQVQTAQNSLLNDTGPTLAPSDSSPTGTLGVNDVSGGTSLQSNLGQQSTGSNSSNNNADNFSQYEAYKDNKNALYLDIKKGTGAEVVPSSKVSILYKGWLTNGQVFDQSRTDKDSGKLQTFDFTEGEHTIITGIEEGIFGMKQGGKRRIVVPPAAGYGAEGKDPIPPNAVMIFDVELIAVK